MTPRWPAGYALFYKEIRKHREALLNGTVLCVDPATGTTSQPGYAVIRAGEVVESGVIELPKGSIGNRLRGLTLACEGWFGLDRPMVLVVERLRGRMVHPHLHWSVGAIVAAVVPEVLLEIPIPVWKAAAAVDPTYVKSDEADARAFGAAVVGLARGLDSGPSVAEAAGRQHHRRGRADRPSGVRNVIGRRRKRGRRTSRGGRK